jgi:hypothetical protein
MATWENLIGRTKDLGTGSFGLKTCCVGVLVHLGLEGQATECQSQRIGIECMHESDHWRHRCSPRVPCLVAFASLALHLRARPRRRGSRLQVTQSGSSWCKLLRHVATCMHRRVAHPPRRHIPIVSCRCMSGNNRTDAAVGRAFPLKEGEHYPLKGIPLPRQLRLHSFSYRQVPRGTDHSTCSIRNPFSSAITALKPHTPHTARQ